MKKRNTWFNNYCDDRGRSAAIHCLTNSESIIIDSYRAVSDELFSIVGELFPTFWLKKKRSLLTKNIYQLFK